jgi:aldehyde:ferredoxin oxidoreductase
LGTGSVPVADSKALIEARAAFAKSQFDIDNPQNGQFSEPGGASDPPVAVVESNHVTGCTSCAMPCRRRYVDGVCNESQCGEVHWYITATEDDVIYESIDLVQEYGLNISDMSLDDNNRYILQLYKEGILGPGKQIDSSPLPMEEIIKGT